MKIKWHYYGGGEDFFLILWEKSFEIFLAVILKALRPQPEEQRKSLPASSYLSMQYEEFSFRFLVCLH